MSDQQEQQAAAPVLNQEILDALGQALFTKFGQYKKDRRPLEEQDLKNLRQFKGIYDPEIEASLQKDRSRAYPKVTRKKVINTVARLMEMLFPQTETNWGLEPSPLPDMSVADTQKLLDGIGTPPDGSPLTLPQIEDAIAKLAQARCDRMTVVIKDQLAEIDWVSLARRVIFSGVLYGRGVLEGPLVNVRKQTVVEVDQFTKKWTAKSVDKMFPSFDFLSVWSYYPDLSAKSRKATDDYFKRHVLSRQQIIDLASRPDFMGDRVRAYLTATTTGDYAEEWWETLLRQTGDKQNPTDIKGRKYEGAEFWGYITGHQLAGAGAVVAEADLGRMYEANVFLLGKVVVKCVVNPYLKKRRPDHVFVYEDDDINLMGSGGLPPVVRDSQLAICESARMALDNAGVVCGPILELNVDLLMPGQSLTLHSYKTFLREDEDRAGVPAVREIKVDSHITELQALIELFMGFADDETALPPAATGDITKGGTEALRTQGNMSMVMSAAALPIRDTVRNFDEFTESVIGSLVDWNVQFNDDASCKGDVQVLARGSTSLIAKEVRAVALDNFKATLTPDELPYLKTRELLMERAKARDLPADIFEDPKVAEQKIQAQAAQVQSQQARQDSLVDAQVKEIFSKVVKNISAAHKSDTGASNETYKVLMEAINGAVANQPEPPAASRKAA